MRQVTHLCQNGIVCGLQHGLLLYLAALVHLALFAGTTWALASMVGGRVRAVAVGAARLRAAGVEVSLGLLPLTGSACWARRRRRSTCCRSRPSRAERCRYFLPFLVKSTAAHSVTSSSASTDCAEPGREALMWTRPVAPFSSGAALTWTPPWVASSLSQNVP